MMMTMVTIALAVLFSALLIGKILMELFPNSGFGANHDDAANRQTPGE
ncbi:hypothetical protein [Roseovarius sp. A46]|nr:hypothetical protein [Roseovarius sp. A46]